MADYTPRTPYVPIFSALMSLAAHYRQTKITIGHTKLIAQVRALTGRTLSRATFFRHVRRLIALHVINRQSRQGRNRDGTFRYLTPRYSFGLRGQQWITRTPDRYAIPLGYHRVSILRRGIKYSNKLRTKAPVDKSPTAPSAKRRKTNRAPRSRGGR